MKRTCRTKKKWLETRTECITATEVSSLFGLNPYQSAKKMFDRKTYPEFLDNIFIKLGKILEPAVIKAMDLELGLRFPYEISTDYDFYLHNELPLGATPDALGKKTLLECKSTNMTKFEEDWEDHPPYYYIMQVHVQLMCVGMKVGYLACVPTNLQPENFSDDLKLKVFMVREHKTIKQMIGDTVKRGWEAYTEGETFKKSMKDNKLMKKLLEESVEKIL